MDLKHAPVLHGGSKRGLTAQEWGQHAIEIDNDDSLNGSEIANSQESNYSDAKQIESKRNGRNESGSTTPLRQQSQKRSRPWSSCKYNPSQKQPRDTTKSDSDDQEHTIVNEDAGDSLARIAPVRLTHSLTNELNSISTPNKTYGKKHIRKRRTIAPFTFNRQSSVSDYYSTNRTAQTPDPLDVAQEDQTHDSRLRQEKVFSLRQRQPTVGSLGYLQGSVGKSGFSGGSMDSKRARARTRFKSLCNEKNERGAGVSENQQQRSHEHTSAATTTETVDLVDCSDETTIVETKKTEENERGRLGNTTQSPTFSTSSDTSPKKVHGLAEGFSIPRKEIKKHTVENGNSTNNDVKLSRSDPSSSELATGKEKSLSNASFFSNNKMSSSPSDRRNFSTFGEECNYGTPDSLAGRDVERKSKNHSRSSTSASQSSFSLAEGMKPPNRKSITACAKVIGFSKQNRKSDHKPIRVVPGASIDQRFSGYARESIESFSSDDVSPNVEKKKSLNSSSGERLQKISDVLRSCEEPFEQNCSSDMAQRNVDLKKSRTHTYGNTARKNGESFISDKRVSLRESQLDLAKKDLRDHPSSDISRTISNLEIRQTRSSKRLQKNKVILIDSSDDEFEFVGDKAPSHYPEKCTDEEQKGVATRKLLEKQHSATDSTTNQLLELKQVGQRRKLNFVRLAIGNTIFSAGCGLEFQPGTSKQFVQLHYKRGEEAAQSSDKNWRATESLADDLSANTQSLDIPVPLHRIYIYGEVESRAIKEINYFILDDGNELSGSEGNYVLETATNEGGRILTTKRNVKLTSFIHLRVLPDKANRLLRFLDIGDEKEKSSTCQGSDSHLLDIVGEVRSEDELKLMILEMEKNAVLKSALRDEPLTPMDAITYSDAFSEDNKREERRRLESLVAPRRARIRSGSIDLDASAKDDEVLLVYPFPAEQTVLNCAAESLHEAGGQLCVKEDGDAKWKLPPQSLEPLDEDKLLPLLNHGRNHYLTINADDFARLEPGEFLNDTLIDFWMRWIWRRENPIDSTVYFFTSHFFTTLQDEGPKAVASWTSKKNINVFEKTHIFLPINQSLHWSLCVVVNPGNILNSAAYLKPSDGNEPDHHGDLSCILFLDSLKAHRKTKVANIVRLWLNYEARRLGQFDDISEPFTKSTMPVYDPRIPYQDNSWDCGVFVCRYAYSMFLQRKNRITHDDVCGNFENAITASPEFTFDMSDIARLREEMKILITRLAKSYRIVKDEGAD